MIGMDSTDDFEAGALRAPDPSPPAAAEELMWETAGRRVRGGEVLGLGRSREGGSGAAVGVHGDGRSVQCRCGPEEGHVGRRDSPKEGEEERRAEEALQEFRVVVRSEGRRLIRIRRTAGWAWQFRLRLWM